MRPISTPNREEQALREVGRTAISIGGAAALAALFLLTIYTVPLAQSLVDRLSDARSFLPEPARLAAALPEALREAREAGPLAANRRLLTAMTEFEERLEERSTLRRRLLPPVQGLMSALLGLGNEQAYPGRGGWLFYRADVDHVVGRGFLEPQVLTRRAREAGGDEATQPDPLAAMSGFREQLGARGIALLALPTPVKPQIHPERFSGRSYGRGALRNPSYDRFRLRLEEMGVEVFDPAELLSSSPGGGEPSYLHTDTHWTPAAMDRVAGALAAHLTERYSLSPPGSGYLRRPVTVEHLGDISVMLRLPEGLGLVTPQRVVTQRVLTAEGRSWRPDPGAEILLLGDSFTNIYSDPALGWGAGAGLAEQLAFHLRRPLDRIAQNAGGAFASRQALVRETASGRRRLDGKQVVIYQFATRELSGGDWKLLEIE